MIHQGTEENSLTLFPQTRNTSAHNSIVTRSSAATDCDDASKKGRVRKLVLIALYAVWLTILWFPVIRENIFRFRQKIPLSQHIFDTPIKLRNYPSRMLSLPFEVRLCIYSHLLPARASRALRATCKQLNAEVRREARKTFLRTMVSVQKMSSNSTVTFFCAPSFHVEVVMLLPINVQLITTPQPRPLALSPFEHSILTVLQALPTNTRSFTLTLQPRPHASTRTFRQHFFEIWTLMENYLAQNANDIRAGNTDLSTFKVLAGAPIVLSPMIYYHGIIRSWNVRLARTLTWSRIEAMQFGQRRDGGKVETKGVWKLDTRKNRIAFRFLNTLAKCGWKRIGLDFRMG